MLSDKLTLLSPILCLEKKLLYVPNVMWREYLMVR